MTDNGNSYEALQKTIEEIKEKIGQKQAKKLNLDLLKRVVKRLVSFSDNCDECASCLENIEVHVMRINKAQESLEKVDLKEYHINLKSCVSHLQNKHKLVSDGFYTGIYLSIGVALGLIFNMLLGNLALGLPIGMCIGIAVGAALDADASKKGLVI